MESFERGPAKKESREALDAYYAEVSNLRKEIFAKAQEKYGEDAGIEWYEDHQDLLQGGLESVKDQLQHCVAWHAFVGSGIPEEAYDETIFTDFDGTQSIKGFLEKLRDELNDK